MLAIKFGAYLLTGSVALYSDALESIVNVLTASAAIAAIRYPAGVDYAGVFVFVWSDGRWLIDDRQRVEQYVESTPVAVPSAS